VPIGVVAIGLTWLVLPRIVVPDRERLDLAGATLAITGLVAFVYGVGRVEESGLGSSLTIGLLAGGLALMAAFALVERKVAAPLAPPRLLRNRSVASANLVSLMANAGFAAAFVVLSLHVQLVLDVGTLATGLVLVPMAASVAVVAGALSPRLLPLVGARRLVVGGMSLSALGLVALGLSIDDGLSWAAVLPGSVAAGTGYGLAFPAWTVVGVERVEDERQGFASGLLTTTQEVGASVGFAIVVTVAAAIAGDGAAVTADSTADGYRWGVIVAGAMSAAGALFALLTPGRVTTTEAPRLGAAVAEPVRA
jgi:MFS family permease